MKIDLQYKYKVMNKQKKLKSQIHIWQHHILVFYAEKLLHNLILLGRLYQILEPYNTVSFHPGICRKAKIPFVRVRLGYGNLPPATIRQFMTTFLGQDSI